jgi:hypothetical protein
MHNSFDDEWWNGVQAVGWILFRAPETVNELGNNDSSLLLQMVQEAPLEVLAAYAIKFPHERALDELLSAMRTGKVAWRRAGALVDSTAGEAASLDLVLHHYLGVSVDAPPFAQHSEQVTPASVLFRKVDVMSEWRAAEDDLSPKREPSPYWDMLQIMAWVATREMAWVEKMDGYEDGSHMAIVPEIPKSITGKPYREQRHHRQFALSTLLISLQTEFRVGGQRIESSVVWSRIVAAHESGTLTLIARPAAGGEPIPIERHALDATALFSDQKIGTYIGRASAPSRGRPLWYRVRALATQVKKAFPRPPDPQIWVSWRSLENEPSPHVDLLAAIEWIARHHCAEVVGNSNGPHENVLQDGTRVQPYSGEKWDVAKTLLRHKLQSGNLSATGRSTSGETRQLIPADFWIDAGIDDFYSNAFDPSKKHIDIDGVRERMRSDVGWKEVRLTKSDVLQSSPDPDIRINETSESFKATESRPPKFAAEKSASEDAPVPKSGRRGPQPGTIARFLDQDRALFPEIERLCKEEKLSVNAAAQRLASEGKVAGIGTPLSRAKRLANAYSKETTR